MDNRNDSLKIELLWPAGIAVLGGIGGLIFESPLLFLLAGVAVYAVWHLYNLVRIVRILDSGGKLKPPFPPGLWGGLYERVRTLEKRSKKRKRRIATFLDRFRESAAAFPDAAIITGKEGNIEWCNAAAGDLLGLGWPGVRGQGISAAVGDPIFREYFSLEDYERPLEFSSPGDRSTILSVKVTRFGKKRQRLLIARDITRQYYLDRLHRDFVANASHELRTPLTVLRGFLDTPVEPVGDSRRQDRVRQLMLQQAERMEETLNDLMSLSRLDFEKELPAKRAVPVPEMIESIIEDAKALSGESAHTFSVMAEEYRSIRGHASWLQRAFSNLVFNAVRHTPPHSRIAIRWTACDGGARFSVEDNGEGIPARHLPRLGERFYRIDPARSRESGGTGLGLSIVKLILSRHDAELKISSEIGKGSVFTCMFPESRLVDPRVPVIDHDRENPATAPATVPK
ncbi:MAG: Phosphate regulon sensor protein PhoR [Gammaproteobacteria bacterium]|nr:Phosphate regulon sensor protein PhoR [Gammaproteobacteria bacterium]